MSTGTTRRLVLNLALGLAALGTFPCGAAAQTLPSEPVSLADGRVTIGGEASVSASTNADRQGWYNYTDYEHNALRLLRLGLTTEVRLGSRVRLLGQVRTDNWDTPRAHALYVRVRPWAGRAFDIQAGRIPPTFGAFARRSYAGTDNPVIGYPLAYQYLTSLRSDAIPANADDLLRMRGEGWQPRFPIGSSSRETGLPLVTAFEWDTGVQVRVGSDPVEISAAVTSGTVSQPHVRDDNGGKQIAARLALRPTVGLIIGLSAAQGPFLADSVTEMVPGASRAVALTQRAFGFDAEVSHGYWLLRAEGVTSAWRLPAVEAPLIDEAVRAWSMSVEGRYTLRPGLFAAGRYDYLGFSDLQGTRVTEPWDAPVRRVEVGGGYYLRRNVIGKLTYQHNWRDSRVAPELGILAAQVNYWF